MTARTVLCFGALENADIIEYFVEYHIRCGIDNFVAVDLGSRDGTVDILERFAKGGRLHLTRFRDPELADEVDWQTQMVDTARKEFGAEWCLLCDVDEFFIFPNNDAPRHFSSIEASIALFPRFNMLPGRVPGTNQVEHFSKFLMRVSRPLKFEYEIHSRELTERELDALLLRYPPEILRAVPPKVAARASVIEAVEDSHDVVSIDRQELRRLERDAYVVHFPIRSLGTFRAKAELVSRRMTGCTYKHWARFAVLWEHNRIEDEFWMQVLADPEIDRLILDGTIVRDDRPSRVLHQVAEAIDVVDNIGAGWRAPSVAVTGNNSRTFVVSRDALLGLQLDFYKAQRVLQTALGVLARAQPVNDDFYVSLYGDLPPDITAEEHYRSVGWREGRDPAPWFSTRGYLAEHPDVATAGINPLTHYLEQGWNEGRKLIPSEQAEAFSLKQS